MNRICLICLCLCFSYIYTYIVNAVVFISYDKLYRIVVHIPYGFIGGHLSHLNIKYAYVYFNLLCLYQTFQLLENVYINGHDESWIDIEGYLIGFTCYTPYMIRFRSDIYSDIS